MHAQVGTIGDLHLGNSTPYPLGKFKPELSGIGLGFCYRGPVITNMLILAYDLTGMASVTLLNIYYKYFF